MPDRDDRIREFGVLVAVVEFANAHVAGRVDFRIVGRTIVDADVLDLHRAEIELAGAPGVFVSAAGAAVIERRDEQAVLALVVDHRRRHARDEIERVVPTCRLHLAVAPYHRFGEALLLRRTRLGKAIPPPCARRASNRALNSRRSPGSGLMTMWTSFPSCLTMLYIDGEYQFGVIAPCCFERSTPNLLSLGLVPPCSLMAQL